jgi:hypothetical protein
MASNSDESVQQGQDDFQNLLAYVTGPDARAQTCSVGYWPWARRCCGGSL